MNPEDPRIGAEPPIDAGVSDEPSKFLTDLSSRLRNLGGVDADVAAVVATRIVSDGEAAGDVKSELVDLRALARRRAGGDTDG